MNEHCVTSEDTALCTSWTEICQSSDETLQDTHTNKQPESSATIIKLKT